MYIGIDVGGTKIAYGLFDRNKTLIHTFRSPTDRKLKAKSFFDKLLHDMEEFLKGCGYRIENINGIGIGLPSFLDYKKGWIIKTGSLPELHDFPVRDYLMEKLGQGIALSIDNDGNAAALAEIRRGAGREFEHMVYCLISTGIGSSIIIDRKLFRGSYGWAGESGHMIADVGCRDEILCGCENRGCFNSYASGKMAAMRAKRVIQAGEKSILPELTGSVENISMEHIFKAADMQDPVAVRVKEQMLEYLAVWLYNMYEMLNINCFVFNGGMIQAQEQMLEQLKEKFNELNKDSYPVCFLKSKLGDKSGIYGAMELLF